MIQVIYQGKQYDAYPIIAPDSATVIGYQLVGFGGFPFGFVVPANEATVIGGGSSGTGTGGVIPSTTAPSNPTIGQVWRNTSGVTVAGVPSNNFAVWNGSQWVPAGTTAPSNQAIASITAPTSPNPGQVWQNTSGATVAGVPSGNYGVWNGTAWVPVGGTAPTTVGAVTGAGVSALNNLSGAVTLAAGANVTITPTGNTLTIASTGGGGGGVAGVSSVNGVTGAAVITAGAGITVTPSGQNIAIAATGAAAGVTSFNTRNGAVMPANGDYTAGQVGADPAGSATAAIAAHNAASDPHPQYLTPLEAFGSNYLAQNTAPTSPALDQIWLNTAAITVAGIPAGSYGIWNGTVWVNSGNKPYLTATDGVTSLNSLVGGVNLVAGLNTAVITTGQNLSVNAITGFASNTAPVNPYPGQVWYNSFSSAVSGINSGAHGVWNGASWISVGSRAPEGALVTSASAPLSPVQGQTWLNISGGTLSGVTTGSHGVWDGLAWINVGTVAPSTIAAGAPLVGFMVSNSAPFTLAQNTLQLLQPDIKRFDTFGSFNVLTGAYTVTGQQGRWIWDVKCTIPWLTPAPPALSADIFCTKNSTSPDYPDALAIAQFYTALGVRSFELENGDVLRFYMRCPFDSKDVLAGYLLSGTRLTRVA